VTALLPARASAFAALVGLLPASVFAQPERLANARVVRHSAAGGLAPLFDSLKAGAREPAWIGYTMPVVGRPQMCCYAGGVEVSGSDVQGTPCGCRLEGGEAFNLTSGRSDPGGTSAQAEPVRLESEPGFHVLFRVAQGGVGRVRTFSSHCALDAGGLSVHWLTEVKPAESLALLASLVAAEQKGAGKGRHHDNDVGEGALAAIAFHADPGADPVLERLAAPGPPLEVRKQAAFWMGQARGRRGFEALRRLVREDAVPEFREHAVFALTQSREAEATSAIIEVAKRDSSAHVRGQALFWLSQKASRGAAAAITRAIEEDPETEVKEKAVFALSQLPKDEGVPLLIQQARTNRNPVVRKQALFWLGQSGDARALAFFEEILAGR
jgi:HEAT repeats